MTTTPKAITERVLELCRRIDPTQSPRFLQIQNAVGNEVNECFINVRQKIAREGGTTQHGWIIWEDPDRLIEGVFHAVWVNPAGELIDITPQMDGEKQILFLPDSKRIYENCPKDNIRLVLTDDPEVVATVKRSEQFSKLREKYNVDGKRAKIPTDELFDALGVSLSIDFAYNESPSGRIKIGRNDPFSCGSGKKFKKCCGR